MVFVQKPCGTRWSGCIRYSLSTSLDVFCGPTLRYATLRYATLRYAKKMTPKGSQTHQSALYTGGRHAAGGSKIRVYIECVGNAYCYGST